MSRTAWLCALVSMSGCASPAIVATKGGPDGGGGGLEPGADAFVVKLPPATDALIPDATSCSRSVSLKAVSIARPVAFDVVIVADNSDSLSWSRDSLSAGLRNLLARVKGHEARFFVLTSTQYGASSAAAINTITGSDLVSWKDSVTGMPYANPMTEYVQTCLDGKGAPGPCPGGPGKGLEGFWSVKGTWQFRTPSPVAAITPGISDVEFSAQQKKVADAVLALGGGGAQQEQPLCTLNRYLTQATLPKHVVFVVLSDEDDTSAPDACLAGYEAKVFPSGTSLEECTSGKCDQYLYTMDRSNPGERLGFSCVPVDDKGMAHPEKAVEKSAVINSSSMCKVGTMVPCSAAELSRAGSECGGGHRVDNCQRQCFAGASATICNLTRETNVPDLCTQPFDAGGRHFDNFAQYCLQFGSGWGPCMVRGYKLGSRVIMGFEEKITPVVGGSTTADLIRSFKGNADRLFGKDAYSVESIVLDPAFSCPVRPGQSHAPNLRQLATSAQDVFPLCQDYAPALQRIESFAEFLIQTEFSLVLDAYEDVDSVLVTSKQGTQRTLPKGSYRYDRAAGVLRFNPGVLGPQDESLAVNVARYCEPVK